MIVESPGTYVQPLRAEAADDSIDTTISQVLQSIVPGCSPAALDGLVQGLCQGLADRDASEVISNRSLEMLNERLRAQKLGRVNKSEWNKLRRQAVANLAISKPRAQPLEVENLAKVRDTLTDAPVPEGAVIPPGWKVNSAGVFLAGAEKDIEAVPTPLVISARFINSAEHTEYVRLAWLRDGGWKQHVCGRQEIATKRTITELAGFGLPVTSLNADNVIRYLADYETHNIGLLPRIQTRRQMGWVDGAMSAFLWGRTLIRRAEPADEEARHSPTADPFPTKVSVPDEGVPASGQVIFQGADLGDEQAAEGYHAQGTFADWKDVVEPALQYPVVRLAITAPFCAPLLSLLGARNFTVDLCGETSKGKTTTLRAAGSVWGLADENSHKSVMTTWNTTRVGAERRAGLVNGLPIIRDDTKLVRRKEDVSQFLYDVTSGQTRERGTVLGLDRKSAFTTVLLTSGEAPAASFSDDGGTRARVLTLWGMPFGRADAETGQFLIRLHAGLRKNYGHAGPQFVKFLLDNRARWRGWSVRYQEIRESYMDRAQGNSVVGRLADAFAVISLAGRLAAEALGISALAESPVEALWDALTAEAADADRATQALFHMWDWACANKDRLWAQQVNHVGPGYPRPGQPRESWAGCWNTRTGFSAWEFIGFIPRIA